MKLEGLQEPFQLRVGPVEAEYGHPAVDVISILVLFAGLILIKKWLK